MKFSEKDTDKALQRRIKNTLVVDTAADELKHVKGEVLLSPNTVTFMDAWWSVYPTFDEVDKNFLTVDTFS